MSGVDIRTKLEPIAFTFYAPLHQEVEVMVVVLLQANKAAEPPLDIF